MSSYLEASQSRVSAVSLIMQYSDPKYHQIVKEDRLREI